MSNRTAPPAWTRRFDLDSAVATLAVPLILVALLLGGTLLVGGATATAGFAAGDAPADQASIPPVLPDAVAGCSLSDDEAPPGTDVTVYAYDSTGADSYQYDKEGDGDYDTDQLTRQYQTFTYDQTGTFTPTVRVFNNSDDTQDTAQCGTLTIDANEDPSAQLSHSPTTPTPGETVTFDPAGTSDPDGDDITSLEYDLDGDGSYETFKETFDTVQESYDQPGNYTVRLRVTDEHGATDVTTVVVEVREPNEAPFATFYYTPESPVDVGETVTFDAVESSDSDGSIDRYVWDFDGDGAAEENGPNEVVTHSYASPGTYTATLTVVDDDGATDTTTRDVTVEDTAEFTCSVEPTTVAPGESVSLQASGYGQADGVSFDVDGDESYEYQYRQPPVSHAYQEAGTYTVLARTELASGFEYAECGSVTVEENQPPDAAITISPRSPEPGDTVTLDASGASDPDGSITEYRWDVDGDGTTDQTTTGPQTTVQYADTTRLNPSVTVVDDRNATDTARAYTQSVVAACEFYPAEEGGNRTWVVDARASEGGYRAQFDVDGDGEYEYANSEFVVTHTYEQNGSYAPRVRVVGELGNDTTTCREIVIGGGRGEPGESGGLVPFDPWEIGGVVAVLTGLGGAGYLLYNRPTGSGTRLPRPPTQLPKGTGLAAIETGTFTTPAESSTVTVAGVGFEPDLILLSATNVRGSTGSDGTGRTAAERTDGWTHGRALRTKGDIQQSTMALADDGKSLDGGLGAASDGHALELLVHYDDPPERVLGTVTETTLDGFRMEFDAAGLRDDRADAEFTVLYQAFAFRGEPKVEVGHFRTPDHPGTQSIDLGLNADHVMLFATNTVDDVGSHLMTDLPLGFSVGDVIGSGEGPAQLVRTATTEPSVPGFASYAAYDDRALHLLYGYDGQVRGRTTAKATALGDRLDLEYEKVYGGPAKLGSTDSKLVSYVAMQTGDVQPAMGYFRLPEPGSDELLAVELGFQPSMVEFQSFGLTEINAETVVDTPLSFGWSHGTVIADDGDLRHQVLDESTGPSVPGTGGPTVSPGVAASVRTLADGGRITGRDEVTVTKFTESGFEMLVTDLGTDNRSGAEASRPFVFYKAWPQPIDADPN